MKRRRFVMGAAASVLAGSARSEVVLRDDGLHDQPFFLDSFLELEYDLADAQAAGKGLIILVEQRGCPYCKELHEVNFERPEITDYLTANFDVLQLDLWGSRGMVGFDGVEREEKSQIASWGVSFTPTQMFYTLEDGAPKEVFRMPGYFKPFHHMSALEYVATGAYADQPFQRFLQDKFAALAEQGIDPEVW
ncbi:thioredoxin family protein [Marivivens aquimaris]|uniref:thioredoxin family protein n=1 Tax=Marivivens aquimaris TaxID=2774876 RepID=UPI0018829805|nr:thioredoxin family protein [Marivivens aquimaris]